MITYDELEGVSDVCNDNKRTTSEIIAHKEVLFPGMNEKQTIKCTQKNSSMFYPFILQKFHIESGLVVYNWKERKIYWKT